MLDFIRLSKLCKFKFANELRNFNKKKKKTLAKNQKIKHFAKVYESKI